MLNRPIMLLQAYKLKSWVRTKKSEDILEKRRQDQEMEAKLESCNKQKKNGKKKGT